MNISVDADGTIWTLKHPELGDILPNAKKVINYWHSRGHTIIINTCRTLSHAENARAYLTQMGIKYDFFNENNPANIARYGSDSRKISADVAIDDMTLNDVVLKKMIGVEGYNNQLWQVSLEQLEMVEKPCIISIVGESGSGKSLAAEYLESMYNINLIESYTDREKRHPEERGHTFLTKDQFTKLEGEQLAFTEFGGNRYCCLTNDLFHINSYVIDEDGLDMLDSQWFTVYDIYSLRIHRPEFDRRSDVGDERVDRDEGRFNKKDNEFDYVINNDSSEKELLYKELDKFMKIFRLDGRSKEYDVYI